MMISVFTLILILIIHLEADFSMQTHQMAINKSKSNYWLTLHVLVYTGVTLLFWRFLIFDIDKNYLLSDYIKFSLFIFTTHWITDYITSRISSKYFGSNDYHNGFLTVGCDQLAYTIQLIIAYFLF